MKKILLGLCLFCAVLMIGAQDLYAQNTKLPLVNSKELYSNLESIAKKRDTFPSEAINYIDSVLQKNSLSDEDLLLTELVKYGIQSKTTNVPGQMPNVSSLSNDKKIDVHYKAAKLFMYARIYDVAENIGKTVPKDVPLYQVAIVDKAPIGVYGWKNSDLIRKNLLKRESRFENYNEKGSAVLYTDVNANRASANVTGKAEKCGVSFFVAADSYGISCYVESKDDKVDEVLAGLAGGGMLEMYLQPGFGYAYYQWLYDVYPVKNNVVDWMSPNEHFRSLRNYLKYETQPIPEGFGVYFFIPWELVYDNLPTSESQWAFGVMPWTRDGGFTWGSGQVHELHKFGRLCFPGFEKILPAVKRNIVLKSFGNFKNKYGAIETFWSDEIRGDTVFYKEVLKPYINSLNEAGKKVSVNMDDETVNLLFREWTPQWNEFQFKVDTLRAEYLTQKYMK